MWRAAPGGSGHSEETPGLPRAAPIPRGQRPVPRASGFWLWSRMEVLWRRRRPGKAATLASLSLCSVADSQWQAQGGYQLQETYSGEAFFSKFLFFTDPDPTDGAIQYVSELEATSAGLIEVRPEGVYMGVDHFSVLTPGEGRRSLRIHSRNAYNAGLFVARIKHAPSGCGVWPAFWMYGEDAEHGWPTWGEFDIVEGVHDYAHTRTTLHTSQSCHQGNLRAGEDFGGYWEPGDTKLRADVCDFNAPKQFENQGCSQRGPMDSMGTNFNANGGGTWAAEWDPVREHIRTWFWPNGQEPNDVRVKGLAGPIPDMWGQPYSYFTLDPSLCPVEHFANMRLVFNIDLCGDMGSGMWQMRGCDMYSLQQSGRNLTCEEFVAWHPELLKESYWLVESLDVYQQGGPLPANLGERIVFDFGLNDDKAASPIDEPVVRPGGVARTVLVVLGAIVLLFGLLGAFVAGKVELRIQRRAERGTPGAGEVQQHGVAEFVAEAQAEAMALLSQARAWIDAGRFSLVALTSGTGDGMPTSGQGYMRPGDQSHLAPNSHPSPNLP